MFLLDLSKSLDSGILSFILSQCLNYHPIAFFFHPVYRSIFRTQMWKSLFLPGKVGACLCPLAKCLPRCPPSCQWLTVDLPQSFAFVVWSKENAGQFTQIWVLQASFSNARKKEWQKFLGGGSKLRWMARAKRQGVSKYFLTGDTQKPDLWNISQLLETLMIWFH